MQGISLCAIIYLTNQSGGNYSFLATIGFITHDKILINSRRIGMIIWIIRIIRKLHRTVYKQKALSCGFRQRNKDVRLSLKLSQCLIPPLRMETVNPLFSRSSCRYLCVATNSVKMIIFWFRSSLRISSRVSTRSFTFTSGC